METRQVRALLLPLTMRVYLLLTIRWIRCHLGKTIVYDTVSKLNWSADIRTHRIGVVIDNLLSKDWEEGLPVPEAHPEDGCMVRRHCHGNPEPDNHPLDPTDQRLSVHCK